MKDRKITMIGVFATLLLATLFILESCSPNKMIREKPGALLWGENCIRCHNAPSPSAFNDEQWETITLHMRVRASLTATETEKIVAFLKMAN